ncbi:MAG: c-type cytochrome [Chloroflexi bacterium]|nr:c-type cytochrome [Chloroflexota bacterium]
MKQIFTGITLALTLALTFTISALAGGWAIITLDELPGEVTAGEPLNIGFTVRQHGVTPLAGLTPTITAQLSGTKEVVRVSGKEEGEPGHYTATLTFPQSGEWTWSINAFITQTMPPLTVVTGSHVASEPFTTPVFAFPAILAGALGLAGVAAGLWFAKKNVRWAIALAAVGLVVGGVGFVSAADQPQVRNEAAVSVESSSSVDQVELGHRLFIAKGCVICHYHSDTYKDREIGVDIGPNLTDFAASPEDLRMWLNDPASVKPQTMMPTLKLKDAEIEALIAFINSD